MSSAPRLFAVSDKPNQRVGEALSVRRQPRFTPPPPPLLPLPAAALSQVACAVCTYLNDGGCVLCEMCGSELPFRDLARVSLPAAAPRTTATATSPSVLLQRDKQPITIDDDDEEGEGQADEEPFVAAEDEVSELLSSSAVDHDAPYFSSSLPSVSPPRSPKQDGYGGRVLHIPSPPRSASSADAGQASSSSSSRTTSAFSSPFFSASASSSTSYPPPAPSILQPLSYIHLPTLPFTSPLVSALLSARRFATAMRKGELALLCAQLLVDSRIDSQLLSPLLACLCRMGVQYRVQQLPVAYSVELYEREIIFEEYKVRHERLAEEKEDGKQAAGNSKPPLDTLTAPLSDKVIPTFFLLIAPRIFCRMYGTKQLHAQLRVLEARARELQQVSRRSANGGDSEQKDNEEEDQHSADSSRYQSSFSVHIMVWGLVSLVAQQKDKRKDYRDAAAANSTASSSSAPPPPPPPKLPFSSVSALTSLSSLWLRSGGVCHVEFHHPSATDAVSTLLLHIRHAASARYKRRDEENTFVFGSLRVVKGRTAAMRGANPIPRKKRKRNRQSADGDNSSDQSSDDSDNDRQQSPPAHDAGSAESILLSYSESWIHMLCMITGVSEERAAVISRHYPTVRALTDAYQAIHTNTQLEYDAWRHGKEEAEQEHKQQQRKKAGKGRLVVEAGETDQAAVARIAGERADLLLADLMCGPRRLGEELSKRVYRSLMT